MRSAADAGPTALRRRGGRHASRLLGAAALACCGGVAAQVLPWSALAQGSDSAAAAWTVELLPDQRVAATRFTVVDKAGQQQLRIEADGSYGNLLRRVERQPMAGELSWRWRVDRLNRAADLTRKQGDDASVKVCALFDMPIADVPFVERQLLRLASAGSGRDLPAATVCYVWDARLGAGTRIDNAYSRRVRYLVLRSGAGRVGEWQHERRDLAADFQALFGDESAGRVPPLQAIAVGADADDTGGASLAWIADMRLSR